MTRIQKERFADPDAYNAVKGIYRIDASSLALMRKYAIVMHPLPRVDEIAPEVDQDPRAAYFRQARNGLPVRMALLDRLRHERHPGRLKATVMDADQIRRSLSRIAHEIVERNRGTEDVVLIGIVAKGDQHRRPPGRKLMELEGSPVAGRLPGRQPAPDDRHLREPAHRSTSRVPEIRTARSSVLVDDVIHHGRTGAPRRWHALMDCRTPRRLAVLVRRSRDLRSVCRPMCTFGPEPVWPLRRPDQRARSC